MNFFKWLHGHLFCSECKTRMLDGHCNTCGKPLCVVHIDWPSPCLLSPGKGMCLSCREDVSRRRNEYFDLHPPKFQSGAFGPNISMGRKSLPPYDLRLSTRRRTTHHRCNHCQSDSTVLLHQGTQLTFHMREVLILFFQSEHPYHLYSQVANDTSREEDNAFDEDIKELEAYFLNQRKASNV